MPSFSQTSRERLNECHTDLQTVFNTVIERTDCSILCGHRGEAAQREAFEGGFSQLNYPQSKHNKQPSMAVDVAPYFVSLSSIDWKDIKAFCLFAGRVLETADSLYDAGKINHRVRWGGDWNCNGRVDGDQLFVDCPHFELVDA